MSLRQLASRRLAARFALLASVSIAVSFALPVIVLPVIVLPVTVLPVAVLPVAVLPVTVLAAWMAIAQLAMVVAFLRRSAAVFGKRRDGSLEWPSVLLLLPYLAFLSGFFHLKRIFFERRSAPFVEVAPGVWLGRRPLPGELSGEIDCVVDLTAEYRERREVLEGRRYFCLPTLNRYVPDDEEMRQLLTSLAAHPGKMLIHCGAGKGRSAAVAAGVLLLRGLADTVEEAEKRIQVRRPVVHLHPVQQRQISRLCGDQRGGNRPR